MLLGGRQWGDVRWGEGQLSQPGTGEAPRREGGLESLQDGGVCVWGLVGGGVGGII